MAHGLPGQPLLTASAAPGMVRVTRAALCERHGFNRPTFQRNEQFMTYYRYRSEGSSAAS